MFVVGIDLGTTRSALAFTPADRAAIEVLPVPQLVAPGQVASLPLLPSAIYLPAPGELPRGSLELPWGEADHAAGALALQLGASSPSRLVVSAKSWLSHAGVDRTAAILPWAAPQDVPRISPVEASARALAHLRAAWDHARPDAPLSRQDVVITVPASFDAAARELTVEAARAAGIDRMRLLEEPQAAFQDWLADHEPGDVRLVLVVDVGGGTTDFTLVKVEGDRLERVAVGDHLILGGDNMDAALARAVEAELDAGPLDPSSWSALLQSARAAKEALLGGAEEARVALPARGTRLVGGTRAVVVRRSRVEALVVDGFLPLTRAEDVPERRRLALTELGLPFAADPAISRHLNAFLRRHAAVAAEAGAEIVDGLPRPDAVLLNGGVFAGEALVRRLLRVLEGWYGAAVPLLAHGSLDVAVARGAAVHGLARRGLGRVITSGSARAYYVGVDTPAGRRAVCVVPRGLPEGAEVEAPREFALALGRPVAFPLYASSGDRADAPGDTVDPGEELESLPPLHTVLRAAHGGGEIPVRVAAQLAEIGTLELSLREAGGDRRWALSLSLREGGGAAFAPVDELPRRFEEARALVERAYGRRAQPVEAREIKGLWRALERVIGERGTWSSAVNRELWGVVLGGAARRRRTAEHERVWFQLAGYCLRPGFGAPLDDWRAGELWKLFPQGVQYTTEKPSWSEWWILWRRVAGGLSAAQQREILAVLRPWLEARAAKAPRPKGPRAEGHTEMLRLAASLERLSAAEKLEVVGWIEHRLASGETRSFWPLGRLLARAPFAGSAHDVVPPEDATPWVERLLQQDLRRADGAAFAAAQVARCTGDRARDLDPALRERVALALDRSGAPPAWAGMVREPAALAASDEMRVFGETLPPGLRLEG